MLFLLFKINLAEISLETCKVKLKVQSTMFNSMYSKTAIIGDVLIEIFSWLDGVLTLLTSELCS